MTTSLASEEVRNREIEGLIEAMDLYNLKEGVILTESEQDQIEMDGFRIRIIPIWKWLLYENLS